MAETKKKTEKVCIPYIRGEATHKFVAINGKTYQIEKGKEMYVPCGVAEILRNSENEMRYADEYIRRNVSDFADHLEKM